MPVVVLPNADSIAVDHGEAMIAPPPKPMIAMPVDRPGLYLALSHNSACNDSWLRGQLAKKLTELPISGASEAVLQRNVERWKAQLQVPADAPKH